MSALDVISRPAPGLVRGRLIDRVLRAPEPVVLIEAAAGMGKSVLLRQLAERFGAPIHHGPDAPPSDPAARLLLWDLPRGVTLPDLPEFASGHAKLVIAFRPGHAPTADRLALYGHALRLGGADLLFTAEELAELFGAASADRALRDTGGWPVLVGRLLREPDHRPAAGILGTFLADQVLAEMPSRDFVTLDLLLDRQPVLATEAISLVPLVQVAQTGLSTIGAEWQGALRAAWQAEYGLRLADRARAAQLADAYLHSGHVTTAITILQQAGYLDWALEIFSEAGGLFYVYRYGGGEYDRVLAGFPESFAREHEDLVVSRAMQALKHGDLERARRVLGDYVGAVGGNPAALLNNAANYSLQLRYFRLMMLIYEDIPLTDDLLDQSFRLLADMPLDADLARGCMLNAIMEFYMRRRHFAQAEDVGERAHRHYVAAGVPILQFYINLHRAIIRLSAGDIVASCRYAAAAARELAEARFDSPGDARLLRMVEGCIAFEGGRAGPLVALLNGELEGLTHGEMWPSIAECLLHYGSQALAEHFSISAAREFLDRWRVYQRHNRQFQAMIEIREAVTLQNVNRWQEAAETLVGLDARISRAWVLRAGDDLARLEDRDEIFLALAWLRHLVFETPRDRDLTRLVGIMLDSLHITGRQSLSVQIWQAYLYRNQGDFSRARQLLQKALEEAGRFGALAPLAEERLFLRDLLGNQRIAEFVLTSPLVRQTMRRLSTLGTPLQGSSGANGLTRRETRVLLLVAEGGSNKFIAQALGLSEATVKFHLGNVYRKLGCKRRREAISAARTLGLVG